MAYAEFFSVAHPALRDNLPYRRFPIGRPSGSLRVHENADDSQAGSPATQSRGLGTLLTIYCSKYVFGGVRPSSGAVAYAAIGCTKWPDHRLLLDISAPEDASPYTHLQSQRDCVLQPRVAIPLSGRATLGNRASHVSTPRGLWPRSCAPGATPLGLAPPCAIDPG